MTVARRRFRDRDDYAAAGRPGVRRGRRFTIFARSGSAVTPSEKSSINTIIGSPLSAFQ